MPSVYHKKWVIGKVLINATSSAQSLNSEAKPFYDKGLISKYIRPAGEFVYPRFLHGCRNLSDVDADGLQAD